MFERYAARSKVMLTTDRLRALMVDGESDRAEFTTSPNNTDKFGEAICAFANDYPNHRQPGYLLVGVDDNGRASGLTVTDELVQNLGALRSNINLEPLPAMTVQKYGLPGGDVAVVEVAPSDFPPVRYKGRVWIRVGPARREPAGGADSDREADCSAKDIRCPPLPRLHDRRSRAGSILGKLSSCRGGS